MASVEKYPDLILLHPPSVLDFRERAIDFGLIADTVHTYPTFEFFPIGFLSMSAHLQQHGFSTRIVNLAVRMRRSRRFNLEKFLRTVDPVAFGIDLHWLPHCDGSLELARLAKSIHPRTPVIMGGLSASYYHREVIELPYVDYVLRGDTIEEPLVDLMKCLKEGKLPIDVPNLMWKAGGVQENPLARPADNLEIRLDYQQLLSSMLKHRDFWGSLPTGASWLAKFASAMLTCRGCLSSCVTCGGSNLALGRERLAKRPVGDIVADLKSIGEISRFPVNLYGDLRQIGMTAFCHAAKEAGIQSPLGLEFFWPAGDDLVGEIAAMSPRFSVSMSPESHDETIRKAFGKPYTNAQVESTTESVLRAGGEMALFFMIGLPNQTKESVKETVQYAAYLREKFDSYGQNLNLYVSPLAPFVDPGSPAFENPSAHGYHLLCRSLADHRQAMRSRTWEEMLNYETRAMSRREIVEASYESAIAVEKQRRRDRGRG